MQAQDYKGQGKAENKQEMMRMGQIRDSVSGTG